MNRKSLSFFDMSVIRQPINQWLCIAFLGLFCYWTMLYYSVKKAQSVADNLIAIGAERMQ